ncbi:MAG: UDP-4-amino-4,6-dideoxy-N-acetyl-beta-L-altrosamine transaminase [Candidatus Omnitrophica bacterium]|nr:UDP-4-amino-4,6-dideoxy-N-acetyl-beta-L-altrosamine transaminase [Candidatus Omnitrophota bacterium]
MKQIPYGRQSIDDEDIRAVVEVLRSDWITQGPKIGEFEAAVARYSGAQEGVSFSSGTSALHGAMDAAGIGPGDEVIVPPITFVATANSVAYCGGTPVFADVLPGTLLIDPASVESRITNRTKAIVAVDFAGQPCDYAALRKIADRRGLILIADSAHSLGSSLLGKPITAWTDMTIFSFHPVKHITTGEGGMVVTSDPAKAARLRLFRNHGIEADIEMRKKKGTWHYEMVDLGFNYRLTDIQAALGLSQLRKLDSWIHARQSIAAAYDQAFSGCLGFSPLQKHPHLSHAYHLYVILINLEHLTKDRKTIFDEFLERGIKTNVHYFPVHLQPFYRRRFGTAEGLCPVAEAAYPRLLSLPLYPSISASEQQHVIRTVLDIFK